MTTKQSSSNQIESYRQCTRCVMDTSARDITFEENGVCNYCTDFLISSSSVLNEDPENKNQKIAEFVEKVKGDGKGKPYDCIIGVSGGVDSSWVLVHAVNLGLRPLAVHMDNGWNSELAQNNIANLVRGLGVDLFTYVIDWEEYRGMMQAFFDADVVDVELLYDNAMLGVNYQQANKWGIKHILAGTNLATEGMRMPNQWNWFKYDAKNIRGIVKRFSKTSINTFPIFSTLDFVYYKYIKKIKWTSFLDLTNYRKKEVLKILEGKYGYKPYPYKHYESIFTRFYQGYILPKKFNIDKRTVHLSCMILTGQMSRDEAIICLNSIPYPNINDQNDDIAYFMKKLKWSSGHLEVYLNRPGVCHDFYLTEKPLYKMLESFYKRNLKKS
jgi:N-acetyl sugar amidotransferase